MSPRLGLVEVLLSCLIGLVAIGLPVTMLVLLLLIFRKLQDIEGLLKKE
jgi:hypothetical protein